MPYLPNPIPILAVKFVGYTVAGAALRKTYGNGPHPLLFAVVRVACGFFLGLVTLPVIAVFADAGGNAALFIWLFVTRSIIWSALVFAMFERNTLSPKRFITVVFFGIALSFALDGILYLLDLVFPGIMSIPMC